MTPTLPGIPGGEPERRPRAPLAAWVELVAATLVATFLLLVVLGFVVELTSSHPHGGSRANEIAGAVACGLAALFCVRAAVRAEHRVRGLIPAPRRHLLSVQPAAAARRSSHYGPAGAAWAVLLFGAVFVFMVGVTIRTHDQATRSAYVQSHGLPASARVVAVEEHEHCGRGGCTHTADIDVVLAGGARADIHFPASSSLSSGAHVSVLLDPRDRSYGELPGYPYKTRSQWLLALAFTAFIGLADLVFLRRLVSMRAIRAAHAQTA